MFAHNYVLGAALQLARRGRRKLCVAWLDLTNVFPSVSHETVNDGVRAAGPGEQFCEIVADRLAAPIAVCAGMKHSCPLNGGLFNIAIDLVIRRMQEEEGNRHQVLAFADNMVILADDPAEPLRNLTTGRIDEAHRASLESRQFQDSTQLWCARPQVQDR